jgi:hypothetical protein
MNLCVCVSLCVTHKKSVCYRQNELVCVSQKAHNELVCVSLCVTHKKSVCYRQNELVCHRRHTMNLCVCHYMCCDTQKNLCYRRKTSMTVIYSLRLKLLVLTFLDTFILPCT